MARAGAAGVLHRARSSRSTVSASIVAEMRFAQARDSSGIRAKRTGAATRSVGAFLKSPGLNFAPHGFSGLELIGISCRVNRRLDDSQAETANHNFVRRLQPRWLDTSTVVGQNFSTAPRSIRTGHGTDASPERVVRTPQDCPLAESDNATVPGQG